MTFNNVRDSFRFIAPVSSHSKVFAYALQANCAEMAQNSTRQSPYITMPCYNKEVTRRKPNWKLSYLMHQFLSILVFSQRVHCYDPDRREEGNKRCFCPSDCLQCLSVHHVHIANNSRTQTPSVPKFGRKVPYLRCDSHTSFKVKRSKVRVT